MTLEDLHNVKVNKIMSTKLITVQENDVMQHVDDLLKKHNINHILVTNKDQELKGILTKNDVQLLKDWATNMNLRTAIKYNDQILTSQTAKDRMHVNLVTVSPNDSLSKCAEIFKSNKFHALPVKESNKLVGILTTYDMLKYAFL